MSSRRSVHRIAGVVLVSCALLVVGFSGTALAMSTAMYDGSTVVITGGDDAAHDIQFRLSADGVHDEIIDQAGIASAPGDCTYVSDPTWISCPGHASVRVDLGGGN